MKRLFDIILSFVLTIIFLPIFIIFSILIWLQDWHSPFYVAPRVGKNGRLFNMVKFRSMVINADKTGVDSTSSDDYRITRLGQTIRKYKIDELPNFYNIFLGQMSFVGPRPNVERDTNLYTEKEKGLLSVRPGVTDFSSIVFSDEGDILEGVNDPDLSYNQLIRPWKSRLGLFYIEKRTLFLDIQLIMLTALAILSKNKSLKLVNKILIKNGADPSLIKICLRKNLLKPYPPPGSTVIVQSRN